MLTRLSEKSVELNFCAQLNAFTGRRLLWFGLTQKEEAKLGFDACTRIPGRLLIFQFKASNYQVRHGRRFYLPHGQLEALRTRLGGLMRSVYYAFPLIGSSAELAVNSDFMTQTWLLDVADMITIPAPTTRTGARRKNELHYVDVRPGLAIIRSEPIEARLLSIREGVGTAESQVVFPGADGLQGRIGQTFEQFWHFREVLARRSAAVLVPSAGNHRI